MFKGFKYHIAIPTILLLFGLSVILSYNIAQAWTNPASAPPTESLTPIAIVNGGTAASSTSQARLNLGAAASGANSDITSLSPSGNLVLTPTGYVGIGTASPGLELGINGGVLANEGLPSCTPTNAGYSFNGDGCYDTGMFSSGDGDLRLYNNQVLTLHATPSGVIIPTGLAIGTTTIPASGIEFPDGTVQTTAYVNPTSGSQTWTTPGTYTWTVPSGVTRIWFYEWGGGGSGAWGAAGYGGASSAFTAGWLPVTPGGSISVVVGVGATAGASSGSASSVSFGGNTVSANGGLYAGSAAAASGTYVIISFPGQNGGGNINYPNGGSGAASITGVQPGIFTYQNYIDPAPYSASPGYGNVPAGGAGGAAGTSSSPNGVNGSQPGGGGGGAYNSSYTPGVGGNGEVILQW
jgi:hypothetical protein